MAAALRQAGWGADWVQCAASIDALTEWPLGVRAFAALHPGVRAFSPSPGLHSDPPRCGSRFGGAARRPPLRGRPVGARIVSTLCTVGGCKAHCPE